MAALNVGRICVKTAGREAGRYACVLKKMDANFVLVTGPRVLTGVKRRRCNVEHLEPTQYSVDVKSEAGDKEVIAAYGKAGLLTKLGLRKPSPEVVKEAEKKVKVEKPEKKEEKPEKKKRKEKPKKEVKKTEEKKPEKEEKQEKKEGIKIKIKVPTLRKAKPKKEAVKVEKKKPEKKKKAKKK